MEMKTEATDQNGGTVVSLTGNLTYGEGEQALVERIKELLAAGARTIRLEVEALRFVDSSGLGALIRCHTACNAAGATLCLASPAPQLRNLLKVARLDEILAIED